MRKLIPALCLAVLFLSALLLLSPVTPAAADIVVGSPAITGTTTVQPLQSYIVTTTGFASRDMIELVHDRGSFGRKAAGADGVLTQTVTVPGNLPGGNYELLARNQAGVTATLAVTLSPYVRTSVDASYAGGAVRIEGFGFVPYEVITATLFEDSGCVTGTFTFGLGQANSFGSFRMATTIPATATAGTYYVATSSESAECVVAP